MNSINSTINGLASSLFLNVGLTSVAEKLDPMQKQNGKSITVVDSALSSEWCDYPCNFAPEAGQ